MNKDLKLIKKYYGEDMMHYCRDTFPTLVEENKMYYVLNKHFQHNKFLYNDLKRSDLFLDFNNYINSFFENKEDALEQTLKTPTELLNDVGYNLYECKCEEDIQAFKKYYASGEELCTFHDDRLKRCHVFFAVKKDVDKIRRENFKNPKRQDEYGTSVISIQFNKNDSHTLSIKNRYNHTVNNPDNTFNNNLDNIIPGLTYSFEHYYDLKQAYINNDFEISGYVFSQGKYYKCNIEKNGVYYCIDNVVIEYGALKQYDKEKYIVMDGFIIDLVNKNIFNNDYTAIDQFLRIPRDTEKIDVTNTDYGKRVTLFNTDKTYEVIMLNKENSMIGYVNNNVLEIGTNFLYVNSNIKYLELNKAKKIGDNFLRFSAFTKEIHLPNVVSIGNDFLSSNLELKEIQLPKCEQIGKNFLFYNKDLKEINLPNLKSVGNEFLYYNLGLKEISLPNLLEIGDNFLVNNATIKEINVPNVICVGNSFLFVNQELKEILLPKCERIGDEFLICNDKLKEIYFPNLKSVGNRFLYSKKTLERICLPKCEFIGNEFLQYHFSLKELYIPKCIKIIDKTFLYNIDYKILLSPEMFEYIKSNLSNLENIYILDENNNEISLKRSLFNPIYTKRLVKSLNKFIENIVDK